MTFDLHCSNDKKAELYRIWVRRVYNVSNILQMSYSELWELSEQEFLVLEGIAREIHDKQQEAKKQLLEGGATNNGVKG